MDQSQAPGIVSAIIAASIEPDGIMACRCFSDEKILHLCEDALQAI